MTQNDEQAPDDRDFVPEHEGPAQFAARAKTSPGNVWFTIGQGWAFDAGGQTRLSVRLTMIPTGWNGELVLAPIPKLDNANDPAD
jgi:hypothetical protein